MEEQQKQHGAPKAAGAQPIVSAFATVPSSAATASSVNAVGAAGAQPDHSRESLQEVLPQINELAQKVGGIKRLAELVNALAQAKE